MLVNGLIQAPTVVWNRELFGDNNTRVCYYHQKAARDSIPHSKHLERGC